MKVRFRKEYALDTNNRIAYEVDNTEKVYSDYGLCMCYNVKLLGLIPTWMMEETNDETDIEAIEVLVNATNNK